MALGSTQPLTEMSTRSISWGQRRPFRKADNLPPSCAIVTKSENLNFLETSGPLRVCNGTALPLTVSKFERLQSQKNVVFFRFDLLCLFKIMRHRSLCKSSLEPRSKTSHADVSLICEVLGNFRKIFKKLVRVLIA